LWRIAGRRITRLWGIAGLWRITGLWRIARRRITRLGRIAWLWRIPGRRIARLLRWIARWLRRVTWLLRRIISGLLWRRTAERHPATGAEGASRVSRRAAVGAGYR
jgi:hypothetical protein